MSRKVDWSEGVELGEGLAALGPQGVRRIQNPRNPLLLGEGWEGDRNLTANTFGLQEVAPDPVAIRQRLAMSAGLSSDRELRYSRDKHSSTKSASAQMTKCRNTLKMNSARLAIWTIPQSYLPKSLLPSGYEEQIDPRIWTVIVRLEFLRKNQSRERTLQSTRVHRRSS